MATPMGEVGPDPGSLRLITLPTVRELTRTHPDVRFEVTHMDTALQLRALTERSIDVGIVRAASATQPLVIEPLVSEPLMLALPDGHRLADVERIAPTDLAEEKFVSWPRYLGADFSDIVVAFCREHGFSPTVVTEGGDIDTQLAMVAAGFGVSLQPAFYARACPRGVVFRPLLGRPPQVALQMAWRRGETPAAVTEFVETARRLFTDSETGEGPVS